MSKGSEFQRGDFGGCIIYLFGFVAITLAAVLESDNIIIKIAASCFGFFAVAGMVLEAIVRSNKVHGWLVALYERIGFTFAEYGVMFGLISSIFVLYFGGYFMTKIGGDKEISSDAYVWLELNAPDCPEVKAIVQGDLSKSGKVTVDRLKELQAGVDKCNAAKKAELMSETKKRLAQ